MDVLIERGAGIDVHKNLLVVCLLVIGGGKREKLKKRFGTFKADLSELRDWLVGEGCTHVVMESTSVYWMPVYEILEGHVQIVVGNAQHNCVQRERIDCAPLGKDPSLSLRMTGILCCAQRARIFSWPPATGRDRTGGARRSCRF